MGGAHRRGKGRSGAAGRGARRKRHEDSSISGGIGNARRDGSAGRRPDPAVEVPGRARRPHRVRVRGGPVDGADGGRHRGTGDRPSGAGDLPEVLSRRAVDRVHGAVRRRRAGLRRADGGRRAAAVDVVSGPRAARAALGLRQPGLRLDPGRGVGAVPVAALQHRPVGQPPLPRLDRRGAPRAPADARVGRGGPLPRTAPGWCTRRSSATSGPGSATRGAGRRSSTCSTARPTTSSGSPTIRAPTATRCGSATPSTSRPTATAP